MAQSTSPVYKMQKNGIDDRYYDDSCQSMHDMVVPSPFTCHNANSANHRSHLSCWFTH